MRIEAIIEMQMRTFYGGTFSILGTPTTLQSPSLHYTYLYIMHTTPAYQLRYAVVNLFFIFVRSPALIYHITSSVAAFAFFALSQRLLVTHEI